MKGSFLERVVSLLEQVIDPAARVHYDVELPELADPQTKRQCDVVVVTGMPPRETRTIVEVQDRKSAVKLNEFRGWVDKMRAVGAQHLICVSRQKFPRSIVNDVYTKHGPTVRLIALRELEQGEVGPVRFSGADMAYNNLDWSLSTPDPDISFTVHGPGENWQQGVGFETKMFSLTGVEPDLSLVDVVGAHLKRCAPRFEVGEHLSVKTSDVPACLWAHAGQLPRRVYRWEVCVDFRITAHTIPVVVREYRQVEEGGGALAWVATAVGEVKGERVEVAVTYVPDVDGKFRVVHAGSEAVAGSTVSMRRVEDDKLLTVRVVPLPKSTRRQ